MKKIIPFSKELPFKTRIAEITDIEISHNLERTPFNTIDGSFLVNGTYKMHEASQIEEKFSYDLPFTIEVDDKYDLTDVQIKISDFFFEIIDEDTLKVNIEVELSEVKEREKVEEVQEIIEPVEEVQPEERLVEKKEAVAEKSTDFSLERCYEDEKEETELQKEETSDSTIDVIEPIDILDSEIPFALEQKASHSSFPKQGVEIQKELSSNSVVESNPSGQRPITDIFPSINNDEDTFKAYYVYIVRENDTLESILSNYHVTKEEAGEYNDLSDLKIGSKLILPCAKNE